MVQRSLAVFVGAAVLVAALVAGCDHNAKTYSRNAKTYRRSDVERAFRSQGFDLGQPFGLKPERTRY
jgi:hypothetical protein